MLSPSVPFRVPMHAHLAKLKPHHFAAVDGNCCRTRLQAELIQSIFVRVAVPARSRAVSKNVLFPSQDAPIRPVKVSPVRWKVFFADDLVGEVEHLGTKLLMEESVVPQVAGAPASVNDLPFTAIDANRVPGVV